jgi:hypothetical protein
MKRLLLAAALLGPAAAGAVTIESLSANSILSPLSVRPQARAAAAMIQAPQEPQVLQEPVLRPLTNKRVGSELGRVSLAKQLDKNLFLMNEVLGSRKLDIGIATDPGAKNRFLTFTDGAGTTLGKIGSLGDLRGKGVDVRVDANTVYNFRVEVGSIFDDPVHKSILHTTPTNGTHGPSYDMTTGALLDVMRAKSAIVNIDGDDYEIFYGRDAKADGSGFANTHGFLITHEAGLSTKAWPLAESALPLNVPTSVTLGDAQVQMTRTATDLIVTSAN